MTSADAQNDLRGQVSTVLLERAEVVVADAAAMFSDATGGTLDRHYCRRLAGAMVRLLAAAVHDGRIDPRGGPVADLRGAVLERSLEPEQLFAFAYFTERSALDELALHERLGATGESWPSVAQLVRRASFDSLAAFVARSRHDPGESTVSDSLTTLHTRRVFDTVLLKETERSSRLGYSLALMLFDVDRLSLINERHGYGVGNRILERLGILMRTFFRQHDWVARYGDDEIAVLLTGSDADHAGALAERARTMVEERLRFTDHRTNQPVAVTVSAAVVDIKGSTAAIADSVRVLIEAEQAVARAKRGGRNRIEAVSGASATRALPHNLPSA